MKRLSRLIAFSICIFILSCDKIVITVHDTVTDIDGNIYKTVMIGNQEWMAENLRVTRYRNGSPIPGIVDLREWSGAQIGLSSDYAFISDDAYGKLYNWWAVEERKDHYLAPKGWHIPSEEEWQTLISYVGGTRLKDSLDWPDMAGYKGELSGFNALPSGYRSYGGTFLDKGVRAYFWTSSNEKDHPFSKVAAIISGNTNYAYTSGQGVTNGYSVRCIKDR
jgi:uncharacterized protein (TIGR02145 family)